MWWRARWKGDRSSREEEREQDNDRVRNTVESPRCPPPPFLRLSLILREDVRSSVCSDLVERSRGFWNMLRCSHGSEAFVAVDE
jgi:hypothetical protein